MCSRERKGIYMGWKWKGSASGIAGGRKAWPTLAMLETRQATP